MISRILLVLLLTILLSAESQAEEAQPLSTLIGAGAWWRPAYDGAAGNTTTLIPVLRHYGRPWFIRTTFGKLEGGARSELLKDFNLGTQLAYEDGRESSENDFLSRNRLPSLPPSASIGLHAELEKYIGPMPLIALLRYRIDVDTRRGAQTDFRLTAGIYGGEKLNAGVFVQNTWANSTAAQYYYGITSQQASSTGLPAYQPQGGLFSQAAGFLWSYELNPEWLLLGSLETRQVAGDSSNSPIVQDMMSRYFSIGVAYQLR